MLWLTFIWRDQFNYIKFSTVTSLFQCQTAVTYTSDRPHNPNLLCQVCQLYQNRTGLKSGWKHTKYNDDRVIYISLHKGGKSPLQPPKFFDLLFTKSFPTSCTDTFVITWKFTGSWVPWSLSMVTWYHDACSVWWISIIRYHWAVFYCPSKFKFFAR